MQPSPMPHSGLAHFTRPRARPAAAAARDFRERLGVPVKVVPISAHDQSDGLFPRKCNQYLGRLCRKKEVVRSLAASGLILLTHLASPNVAAYAEEFNPKGLSDDNTRSTYSDMVKTSKKNARLRLLFTSDAYKSVKLLRQYREVMKTIMESQGNKADNNRRTLEQAWQTIANEFYEPQDNFKSSSWAQALVTAAESLQGTIESTEATHEAIDVMVSSLGDRYTTFLDAEEYRKVLRMKLSPSEIDYFRNQNVGPGIEVSIAENGRAYITDILPESAAEQANLFVGDQVLSLGNLRIDGVQDAVRADSKRKAVANDLVLSMLRGPQGSNIKITTKGRDQRTRQVTLERKANNVPPTRSQWLYTGPLSANKSIGKIRYIRLHYFNNLEQVDIEKELADLADRSDFQGVVLDLRGNSGGVFEEGVSTSALFLDPGTPIATLVRSRDSWMRDVADSTFFSGMLPESMFQDFSPRDGIFTKPPLVLLVDGRTASSAELFAAALRLHGRAMAVVGDQTFGKGLVQYFFPLRDGSGLKITVAKFLAGGVKDIDKDHGLSPDMRCIEPISVDPEEDACVKKAMEILTSKRSSSQ